MLGLQEQRCLSYTEIDKYVETTKIHIGVDRILAEEMKLLCVGETLEILQCLFRSVHTLLSVFQCACACIRHLDLSKWHLQNESRLKLTFDILVEHEEITVETRKCRNRHRFSAEQSLQKSGLASYLLKDLATIVMEYSHCYTQFFKVGMPISLCLPTCSFAGTITHIVTIRGYPFLLVKAETYRDYFAGWVSAQSEDVRCFYDSRNELIEQAKFNPPSFLHPTKMDLFRNNFGDWIQTEDRRFGVNTHTVTAEYGTFTS